MAKVSEFSDVQLEKLFLKYQTEYKKKPTDKVKKQLVLIQRERKKRKEEQTAQSDTASDLSKLIEHADVNTKKRKQQSKQKQNKISNKMRKGSAPAISQMKTNILLGLGLIFGFSGLILVLDCFVLYMLPTFSGKMIVGIILVLIGIGCSKAVSFLSDDNR